MAQSSKKEWYQTCWGIIIAILFLPIFIVWYVWAKSKLSQVWKIIITVVIGIMFISALANEPKSSTTTKPLMSTPTPKAEETKTEESKPAEQPKAEETENKEMNILQEQKTKAENTTRTATSLITEDKMSEAMALYNERWNELAKLRVEILYDNDLSDAQKKNIDNALKTEQESITNILSMYEQLYR